MWLNWMVFHDENMFNLKANITRCNFSCNLSRNVEKEIYYKLQETRYTLQSRAAACNGFKKSLQSLQKLEPRSTAIVTRCDFLCNLCCNGVARQVTVRLQHVTCSLCNLSCNFFGLATIAESRAWFYTTFIRKRQRDSGFYRRLLGPVSDHVLINCASKERALHQPKKLKISLCKICYPLENVFE